MQSSEMNDPIFALLIDLKTINEKTIAKLNDGGDVSIITENWLTERQSPIKLMTHLSKNHPSLDQNSLYNSILEEILLTDRHISYFIKEEMVKVQAEISLARKTRSSMTKFKGFEEGRDLSNGEGLDTIL